MYALKGKERYKNRDGSHSLPHLEDQRDCSFHLNYILTDKGYFTEETYILVIRNLVRQIPDDDMWRVLIVDG